MRGEIIDRVCYDHDSGKFTDPIKIHPNKFIVFQGLMTFLLDKMRNLPDLKIYMEADEVLRMKWKILRDQKERKYQAQTVSAQIEKRRPDAEKFIHPQKQFADWSIHYTTDKNGFLSLGYLLKNSIKIDALVAELKLLRLEIEHKYHSIDYQQLCIQGDVDSAEIEKVAYSLYPNLNDLVEGSPKFESGLMGVHQIFFINYLYNFYNGKNATFS
ncbi:MAG: phosphoribulokinase [Parcubacteria group bacterium Licking1014_17]|nr:MAG: phosphoribulokinase [Parcubacteria group bacterium Licking1014_17]